MTTKIRCILLDDELPGLAYLKMLCEQIPTLDIVKAFNSPTAFLDELPLLSFDLCITDIEMPGISGLQIANVLNGKLIIFTTAYKEFAAEAYDLDAVDYVRKPLTMERLRQAVAKAATRLENTIQKKPFVQLNTDRGKAFLFFDQIVYITVSETDSRDKTVWLTDQTPLLLKNISFENLLDILPHGDFVRISKKEIVALKQVKMYTFDEITTTLKLPSGGNAKLSLSESYREGFLNIAKN